MNESIRRTTWSVPVYFGPFVSGQRSKFVFHLHLNEIIIVIFEDHEFDDGGKRAMCSIIVNSCGMTGRAWGYSGTNFREIDDG